MRIGTPSFVGARLTEAREARGLTQTALAELSDVQVSSISQYEQGKQTPSPEALHKLASKLNKPEVFFLRPAMTFETEGIKFRSQAAATKGARTKGYRKLGWIREIYHYLSEYVDFPDVNLPTFCIADDPHQITFERIEEIAGEARSHWNLGWGPIHNVVFLLENNGVVVSRIPLDAETLDAFSSFDKQLRRPFVFLSSDKESAARSRFDAAHELGHLILHAHLDSKLGKNSVTYKLMEDQAHRFASAFLLPEHSFAKEIWAPTLDAFAALKKHWRVSIATMIMRTSQLGLVSDEQARRLWINLSRKGWRTEEPLDRVLVPEEPALLRNTFKLLVEEAGRSREQLLSDLCLNASDIEVLCSLPKGFFSSLRLVEEPIVRLRAATETVADVIPFKARFYR